jgi:hypothetical protein
MIFYAGVLSVEAAEDLGGSLQLSAPITTTTSGISTLALVRPLAAAATATGTLTPNGSGTAIGLTGTYDGSRFAMSGGGYTVTATVSGGTLSGTGTAPGGQVASVTGAGGMTFTSSPLGTYEGQYRIVTTATYDNTRDHFSCAWKIAIAGTMTAQVLPDGKAFTAAFDETWTESETSRGSCPFAFNGGAPFSAGGDAKFSSSIHYSVLESGGDGGNTIQRLRAFDGAVICGTGMVGTITKSVVNRGPAPAPGPPGTISSSARGSVSVTLLKHGTDPDPGSPPANIPPCSLGN